MLDKAADLDALLAISVQRTIQRDGIRLYGLRFRSKVLEKLLQRSGGRGREYAVKINPDELLWVPLYNDMTEKWEYIPCDTPEYVRDIGLEEWRRQCILARKLNGGKSPARRHVLEARRLLNEEAARRGAVPRKRIEQRDIEEYQEQVDDPLFEILDEDRAKRRSKTSVQPARAAGWESLDHSTIASPDRDPASRQAQVETTPQAEPPVLESGIADDDWDHDGDIHDPDDPDDPQNWR